MQSLLDRILPNQAGVLWIAILVTFFVFGNLQQLTSPRNIVLALLLLLAPMLVDLIPLTQSMHAGLVWVMVFGVTFLYFAWAILLSRTTPISWEVRVPGRGLRALVALLIVLDAAVVFGHPPDDAGRYSNLAAQRWLETGALPYADKALSGPNAIGRGGAATYGPVLYGAHVPVQLLLGSRRNPAAVSPGDPAYTFPPNLATQIVCFAFFVLGLAALYGIVRRDAGLEVALGVTAVWAASPFVLGVGGSVAVVGGLRYISHIAPAALTLVGLLLLEKPVAAGAMLALATGVLFYPIFFFPAWLGWYAWRSWKKAAQFTVGCAVVGLVLAAVVLVFTHAAPGESAPLLFLQSTFGHQEGTQLGAYGSSPFGFWGTHPALAAFWQRPLVGASFATHPIFLLYALFVLGSFFLARGRTRGQLAGLTAALALGTQLWKTHGGGTYVGWYYPLLLVAVFAGTVAMERADPLLASPLPTASAA